MGRNRAPLTGSFTARVDALNHEGWGVVRAGEGGKTTFVAGALPGELVEYRVRKRERSHDEAELLQVLEPSAERIEPRCAHFGVCGAAAGEGRNAAGDHSSHRQGGTTRVAASARRRALGVPPPCASGCSLRARQGAVDGRFPREDEQLRGGHTAVSRAGGAGG